MKKNQNLDTEYAFFASSNGYDGFNSYFDNVFSSRNFERVFVLKGGPGTGKSTLMKKIGAYGESMGYYVETILCSSDANSLDGVILKSNNKSIAVLDGTAPHERDAIIPGATDEIVNLGEGWKTSMLQSRKSEIFDLNSKKTRYYKLAYDNLNLSSIFDRKTSAEIAKYYDFKKASEAITALCKEVYTSGDGKRNIRLISSFSKDGYKRLDTLENISDRVIRVKGKFGSEKIFLSLLRADFQKTDMDFTMFPSPFDKNTVEAIFVEGKKIAIIAVDTDECDINTLDFLDKSALEDAKDELIDYRRIRDYFIEKARRHLEKASEVHFKLEEIYTPAMDFLILEEIKDTLIEKCKLTFE